MYNIGTVVNQPCAYLTTDCIHVIEMRIKNTHNYV